jgi:hypothetical protein
VRQAFTRSALMYETITVSLNHKQEKDAWLLSTEKSLNRFLKVIFTAFSR